MDGSRSGGAAGIDAEQAVKAAETEQAGGDGDEAGHQRDVFPRRGDDEEQRDQYQAEHDALFDAIRSDKPYNEVEYGALSTMTAILGRMATYSGKVVKWDEALQSSQRLTTEAEAWDAKAPILPDSDGWYAVAVPGVTKVV